MNKYSHLISVEQRQGNTVIKIDIVPENGKKYFSNEIVLPSSDESNKWELFDEVACRLGKALCIDNPEIRKHFNLVEEE